MWVMRRSYTAQEEMWLEAIVSNVSMGFERAIFIMERQKIQSHTVQEDVCLESIVNNTSM